MSKMIFEFPADGEDAIASAHAQSLEQWLNDTGDLRRARIEPIPAPSKPGQQGGLWLLGVALVFDAAARAIAEESFKAYIRWLSERFKSIGHSIPIRVTCPNGAVVEATVRRQEDVQRFREALLRACQS